MPSPLPPSAHSSHGARVTPVMFGEEWTDPNGETRIADQDGVLLEFLSNGEPAASSFQSPKSAMALAQLLMGAAGTVIGSVVDDNGQPLSSMERLRRFNTAFKDTK
jgi:hypothetical protein